jgi:hypothetical protein
MYKYAKKHLEGVKDVIDAEAYTGGILERAKDAAVSKDDEYIENIMVASRCHKKSHKMGRKRY